MEHARLTQSDRLREQGFPNGLCYSCYEIEKETWRTQALLAESKGMAFQNGEGASVIAPPRQAVSMTLPPKGRIGRPKKEKIEKPEPASDEAVIPVKIKELRQRWLDELEEAKKNLERAQGELLVAQCRVDVMKEILDHVSKE